MKFVQHTPSGPQTAIMYWSDHWPSCARCREVDMEKSATFVNACAQGSPLLMEELSKRQAPVEKQKRKEVKEWAKKAGVFKTDSKFKVQVKYVEEK